MVGPQPLQRALDRPADALRRGKAVAGLPGELGGEHDLIAPSLEDLSEQTLAATSVPVDLGRVEEGHPSLERGVDDCPRLV